MSHTPASESTVAASPESSRLPGGHKLWIDAWRTIFLSAILAVGIRTLVVEARYISSESMLPTLQVDDHLLVNKLAYRFKGPARGDIVVFSPTPALEKENYHDAFIKRVIGLPGDKVEVRDRTVYINDQPLRESYLDYAPNYEWGPQLVPDKAYWVLGDYRNRSYDSHYWGFVTRDRLIGQAVVRFWPPQRLGPLKDVPKPLPPQRQQ
jgi:signal peptidase I